MKKILISCLITVSLFSVGASSVQASHVKTYPLYNVQVTKHSHKQVSIKKLKKAIYILSIQLGANHHSMMILQHKVFKHDTNKQLLYLYKSLNKSYAKINHHYFHYSYWK